MAFPSIDMSQLPQFPAMPINMPQPHAGMFGAGGVGRNIAGLIGDALMARAGMQPIYAPTMVQRQEMVSRAKLAEQQRQQQMQDAIAEHQANRDYDISHSPQPDIQDRIDALEKLQPGLGLTYAKNYAQNGGGMGPVLTNPLTGQTMVPAGKAPAMEPPAEAVTRLRSNPGEASQFDEIFGPGASSKYLGGQTGSAPSGGFL